MEEGYAPSPWPRRIVGSIAIAIVLYYFFAQFQQPLRQAYFDYVVDSCASRYGINDPVWEPFFGFDQGGASLFATEPALEEVVQCVGFWAAPILDSRVEARLEERPYVTSRLYFWDTGSYLVHPPPREYFIVEYIEPRVD